MRVSDLDTPALLVDAAALEENLATMAEALPGARLRPHVKAHKCTGLARRQAAAGHRSFTCATIRECEGMVAAGLGEDLLLANEVLDARRLGNLVAAGARITLAVDSAETIEAAVAGGVPEVLIDVNVGLPRCGCSAQDAGPLAELARRRGLSVRGVMGYEGHVVGLPDGAERAEQCKLAMEILVAAHADVGGELISAGGTGTYALNTWANEIQAGSYALMDTAYGRLGLPFRQAAFVLATVVSRSADWAVGNAGLKAFGMDHGNPDLAGSTVLFCSDEHVTFSPPRAVGELAWLVPAHIDPTMAYHERVYLFSGDTVVDVWPIDLRGW
ncbi:MAG TPA: alanine racemase [Streptosporangiaceae bacterium]|jgi:D-serine deaminase-like pyridoxal phosphate-dependent protein